MRQNNSKLILPLGIRIDIFVSIAAFPTAVNTSLTPITAKRAVKAFTQALARAFSSVFNSYPASSCHLAKAEQA